VKKLRAHGRRLGITTDGAIRMVRRINAGELLDLLPLELQDVIPVGALPIGIAVRTTALPTSPTWVTESASQGVRCVVLD